MKKLANNLCGTDIGKTIAYQKREYGPWNAETRSYEGSWLVTAHATVTMITHKKSGDVSVRVYPVTRDLIYDPDDLVELS